MRSICHNGDAICDMPIPYEPAKLVKRDEIGMNRHRSLGCCVSMIFSENRFTLFRIML
jgi:hypothetical protein